MSKSPRLGVLIVGYSGAISSTIVAGLDLMSSGLAPKLGMLCETKIEDETQTIADRLKLPNLSDIVVSGWDLVNNTIEESLKKHQVLNPIDIGKVSLETKALRPMPVPLTQEKKTNTEWGSIIEQLRQDISNFRVKNNLNHVVVVNCISTQATSIWSKSYESLDNLKKACSEHDSCINSSIQYACAALLEYAGYINFTPNIVEIPAILELAHKQGMPIAGRDGKTGQTLIKTALAPTWKLRDLKVAGWFSTNILGNRDGEALAEPEANQTKVTSKENCLDQIMGYPIENHQVYIHYYRPRKDNKEAWDNIDLEGFLGYAMQFKINFLCKDSILAAPLIIDMVRLMAVCLKYKEFGLLPQFSIFFKSPVFPDGIPIEHDLFKQREMFEIWIKKYINLK